MKSLILGGILVQLDGIKCDANILDPVLKREMIISVKNKQTKKKQKTTNKIKESDINYL